ncbi:MAG: GntR family transcriptional regulator [Thermodesulfobacteriota bacterium]|nr:GntR family transcriptional regulator [Thermodesulfobacteriota bacterium]
MPDKVYCSLEKAILEGKIRPGDRLIEDELSKGFGVSRGPIREALRLLEKDGLIRRVPRKGAIVQWISKEDISEIYEIVAILEGLAARNFCKGATGDELAKLRQIYQEMETQVKKNNVLKYQKLNREFHEMIVLGSNNKKVKAIYNNFQKQIRLVRKMNLSFVSRPKISLKEHKNILNAILRKQPGKAEQEARQHIERAASMFLSAT